MAFIFKKTLVRWFHNGGRISARQAKRLKARGKPVERRTEKSRKWYIRLRLPDGRTREVPGYTDRQATLALATKLEKEAAREAAGLSRPTDRYLTQPVETHLADFTKDLEAKGRTEKHIRLTLSRIRKTFELAHVTTLADIRPQAIRDAILTLPLSTETRNHHLVATKAFTRWLWRQGRLPDDPLAGVSRWNAEVDRRVHRRALTSEEVARLITTTQQSPRGFRGLDGKDRAALYLLAAYSGLRASEMASLTRAELSLDSEPPTVTVRAAYAKNKRQDTIPLPRDVADYLRRWLSSRPTIPAPGVRLWPGTWAERAAQMIRQDLQASRIEVETESGRLDFHCLRGTYATLLARVGVNLQTAQALMRHSDPKLTARTYTKLGISDLAGTVAKLQVAVPSVEEASRVKKTPH
jgi:integrase